MPNKTKQLTFPYPTICTHVYPDGTTERVKYGYFESIQIVSENGHNVNRTITLEMPTHLVLYVIKSDGTKVIFDKPWYMINEK